LLILYGWPMSKLFFVRVLMVMVMIAFSPMMVHDPECFEKALYY
jgi:hypothetical protein